MKVNKVLLLIVMISFCFAEANAQVKKEFEGEIVYRNFENHSKMVRRFSSGMAYNGARTVRVIMKGSNMHIIDESLQMHTLLLPEQSKVILYSDCLERGMEFSFGTYVNNYMMSCSPEPRYVSGVKQENKYSMNKVSQGEFNGEICDIYKVDVEAILQAGETIHQAELWVSSKYDVYKCYWYFLNGIEVPGIVLKRTLETNGKVPIFGKMNSFVASEVKEIKERAVSDDEMCVPENYDIKVSDSPFKVVGLMKDTKKYLKKKKMYPGDADKDLEVTYKIDEEWDF